MTDIPPTCVSEGVYNVKITCAILSVCKITLQKYRRRGYIKPINENKHRFLYSGQAIIDCWHKLHEV